MTVAEMIAKRTVALRTILHDSGQAIHYKGGTPADDLSGLQDAILSIPSGGGELPELTTPAEVGHVVAGKEYIDGNGDKRAGTLVVCDTVKEVEYFGIAGTGVSLDIESSADGSVKTMTLPEENLKSENIKSGISIFHVAGSVKEIRTETGTWTPTEETKEASIACTAGAKAFCLEATEETIAAISGQTARYIASAVANFCGAISGAANCATYVWIGSAYANAGRPATNTDGFYVSSSYNFYAGAYRWTAYYWDD